MSYQDVSALPAVFTRLHPPHIVMAGDSFGTITATGPASLTDTRESISTINSIVAKSVGW